MATERPKEDISGDIKKKLLNLEKLFLDNVLTQVKKKNVDKNSSVEKLAMNELNKYKKSIEMLKSRVSIEDNTDKIVKLENKLKENQEILQKLNNEKEGLEKISKQQLKALEEVCLNETQIQIHMKYEEIRQIKEQTMKLKNIYSENEHILKKKQEQLINIDNQLKKKIMSIKNSKSTAATTSTVPSTNASNISIQTLKAQIDMINNNIALDTQMYDEKIKELEKNIEEAEKDIEFLNSQMGEIKKNIENISLEVKRLRKQKKR